MIVANAIFIGFETDYSDSNIKLDGWYFANVFFNVFFCIELICRLYSLRLRFFLDGWNIFDFLLVTISTIDTFILENISSSGSGALGTLSMIRVLRILRVARVLRLLRFFKPLWLLVVGALDAMRALSWAWVLISGIIYFFAIILTRTVGHAYGDNDPMIHENFGSLPKSMFTLFRVMTLDTWSGVARNAMTYQPWIWIVFVLFLLATTFSIMNMIISVIVDSTLEKAADRKLALMKEREADLEKARLKVDEVFGNADADGDGHITKEELAQVLAVKDVQTYLMEVGIDLSQAEYIFDVMDYDESGSLEAQELKDGLLNSRGDAQSQAVLALQCHIWRRDCAIRTLLQELCIKADQRLHDVDTELEQLQADLTFLGDALGLSNRNGSCSPSSMIRSRTDKSDKSVDK